MMKEVSLYHQMNGGIHMNQLVTGKFIALNRKQSKKEKSVRNKKIWSNNI